ncbi:MAG: chemotaxis protein CheA [Promethearchaeota archaeon]
MENKIQEIDPEVLAEFIDESQDALLQIPSLFVTLEKNPKNKDIINQIFRPVHSLKGNAAFFGFLKMKDLAHKMETLLDKARQGQLTFDKKIIDMLLKGVDFLIEMLGRSRELGSEIEETEPFNALIEKIKQAAELPLYADRKALQEAIVRLQSLCSVLGNVNKDEGKEAGAIVLLLKGITEKKEDKSRAHVDKSDPNMPEPVKALRKILSDKFDKLLPDEKSSEVAKHLEKLNDDINDPAGRSIVENAIDNYQTMISTVGFDNLLRELLLEGVDKLCMLCPWSEDSSKKDVDDKDVSEESKSSDKSGVVFRKTMRVAEKNIDKFLEYVGELIIVREMFNYLRKRIANSETDKSIIQEFRRANDSFTALSHNLQQSIMEIRRIPVKGILQKAPRIVRDIASATGKEIDVNIVGEDVDIDKSIIEALEAPVVHMIRNTADHGIELPAPRIEANKPPNGIVNISVVELTDLIEIKISDDGAGIDFSAIREKGERLGLVKAGKNISDEEITNLIFMSGVSTAKKVTDVSGRGVGMDVVKRNIEKVGGKISVSSVFGKGTEFTIKIPKTIGTQIISGFLVRVGEDHFILPSENIVEAFNAPFSDFTDIAGKGMCVKRRDEIMPFIYSADVFGLNGSSIQKGVNATVIAIKNKNQMCCLGVDEILGLQEIVVKPVEGLEQEKHLFTGAAITGSGNVSMIVDIENIFN